jgi:hypothetical protein
LEYLYNMKLLSTIQKIIKEAEEQYQLACENTTSLEELDRLEKHYKDSLKLLKLYKSKSENPPLNEEDI